MPSALVFSIVADNHPSLPLVFFLRDPVLYLEHVGRDRLQPAGDGELRLDGDVDHRVDPAGLQGGQVLEGVPGVDITGEGREELEYLSRVRRPLCCFQNIFEP